MTPEPDADLVEQHDFVARLEWTGTMVDVFPVEGCSVAQMLSHDLDDPIGDIYDANDTSRFSEGEHLGFLYATDDEYDLRVA